MIDSEYLKNLFPRESDIPSENRQLDPVHQRTYLVDGELKTWEGKARPSFPRLHVHQDDGALAPVEIGSYPPAARRRAGRPSRPPLRPTMTAVAAWPTMAVAERIACMQEFTKPDGRAPARRW